MSTHVRGERLAGREADQAAEGQRATLRVNRRSFLHVLGAGILITVTGGAATAQRRGGRRRGPRPIATRLHIGEEGTITVMTGKVELGQGARTEITQAAAEELRVAVDQIRLVMADTDLVPDDGTTAGSRTTPSTIPAVRRGAAAARDILAELAAEQWQVDASTVAAADGAITHLPTNRRITYAELAKAGRVEQALRRPIPDDVEFTPVEEWKVLGTSTPRPNARDLVTGAHRYASDISRPGMLYGAVLRPPSYGATLESIDLSAAEVMQSVTVVREGDFVGCVAPTSFQARQAVEALAKSASWEAVPQPSSAELWDHLQQHASGGRSEDASVDSALQAADKTLSAEYHTAYVQHAPMEPGAAVGEWEDGRLTVWLGSRSPFRQRSQLAEAFGLAPDRVRVIVPDTGGGFGMKSGDFVGIEAARLAKAVGRPVHVQWSREEEFTWAYFRPAALIHVRAGLNAEGAIVAWDFTNTNSGGSAINTPYAIPNARANYRRSDPPLRQGSYRALAATANNFARECFMDELAAAAGTDPLAFRLAHLEDLRLRTVLEVATERFDWARRKASARRNVGVGLACGTEKASYVAACAEVAVNRQRRTIQVRRVCEVFECGTILNPDNLRSQVYGCIIMGLGAALREEMQFENGRLLNPRFSQYEVPRFEDVPELDVHLINRPDIAPAGGGETPIIAIGPTIANAVFDAVGVRVREMPIRL
ncbi:MAG: molybdopterin cofactor-binding domain-containing protein [Armatimonadota bacterium]